MSVILAFGSQNDPQAWNIADELKKYFPDVKIVKTENPDDVLNVKEDLIILDVAKGIDKPMPLTIDDLKEKNLFTLHDFDIGFFLKLLKEINKIGNVKIVGIPVECDDTTVEDVKKLLKI